MWTIYYAPCGQLPRPSDLTFASRDRAIRVCRELNALADREEYSLRPECAPQDELTNLATPKRLTWTD